MNWKAMTYYEVFEYLLALVSFPADQHYQGLVLGYCNRVDIGMGLPFAVQG